MSAEEVLATTQFDLASKVNKTKSGEFCQICKEVERFRVVCKFHPQSLFLESEQDAATPTEFGRDVEFTSSV